MWFLDASCLYHLDVAFGQALQNHHSEGDAVKIAWLLDTGLRNDLGSWLGHDQRVDILTLNTVTPLWRTTEWQCRCCRHNAIDVQVDGMQSNMGDQFAILISTDSWGWYQLRM